MRSFELIVLIIVGGATTGAFAAEGADPIEGRSTRSSAGFMQDRQGPLRDSASLRAFEPSSEQVARKPRKAGGESRTAQSAGFGDMWIYDATTELFHDFDRDGYYHYLRVRFDADTYYEQAYAYAKLYVSIDGEFWELLFVTDDFLIEGSSPYDDYEIETELVSGYPRGYYDVLVELYDADYGVLVDEFGPAESSAFSLLPLEDAGRDGFRPVPATASHGHGGGGAASWLLLVMLSVLAGARRVAAGRHCSGAGSRRRYLA